MSFVVGLEDLDDNLLTDDVLSAITDTIWQDDVVAITLESSDFEVPTAIDTPHKKEMKGSKLTNDLAMAASPTQGPRKRKREKETISPTTKPTRRRNKQKIEALRKHVQQLEMQVDQLRQHTHSKVMEMDAFVHESQNWREVAAYEYKARLESEQTNLNLKNLLARQLESTQSLSNILQGWHIPM